MWTLSSWRNAIKPLIIDRGDRFQAMFEYADLAEDGEVPDDINVAVWLEIDAEWKAQDQAAKNEAKDPVVPASSSSSSSDDDAGYAGVDTETTDVRWTVASWKAAVWDLIVNRGERFDAFFAYADLGDEGQVPADIQNRVWTEITEFWKVVDSQNPPAYVPDPLAVQVSEDLKEIRNTQNEFKDILGDVAGNVSAKLAAFADVFGDQIEEDRDEDLSDIREETADALVGLFGRIEEDRDEDLSDIREETADALVGLFGRIEEDRDEDLSDIREETADALVDIEEKATGVQEAVLNSLEEFEEGEIKEKSLNAIFKENVLDLARYPEPKEEKEGSSLMVPLLIGAVALGVLR
jgi:hypothetical protein